MSGVEPEHAAEPLATVSVSIDVVLEAMSSLPYLGAGVPHDNGRVRRRITNLQSDKPTRRIAFASAGRVWYADMLLARAASGDRDRARVLLAAALLYESIGMPGFAERTSARLAATAS